MPAQPKDEKFEETKRRLFARLDALTVLYGLRLERILELRAQADKLEERVGKLETKVL